MAQETWDFAGSAGTCSRCGAAIKVRDAFFSTLVAAEDTLARCDFCAACWSACSNAGGLAFWRTMRLPKEAPRRRYVKLDIDVVWQIFSSMKPGSVEGLEGELRYVLALILLRRRRLELTASGNGELRFRDKEQREHVLKDPTLGEERIKDLTEKLGDLLWEREFEAAAEK